MIVIGIMDGRAIALPIKRFVKGHDAGLKADLHSLADDVDSHYIGKVAYPATLNLWATGGNAPISASFTSVSPGDPFTYELSTAGCLHRIWRASQDWVRMNDSSGLQPSSDIS